MKFKRGDLVRRNFGIKVAGLIIGVDPGSDMPYLIHSTAGASPSRYGETELEMVLPAAEYAKIVGVVYPSRRAELSAEHRCRLACEVFMRVFEATEAFSEDYIGVALAYLLGAIVDLQNLETSYVDWSSEFGDCQHLRKVLEKEFPTDHIVWQFVVLKDRP